MCLAALRTLVDLLSAREGYVLLTFIMACWICCAIITGLLVAVVAGVAYGYNYCMAEWLTFTRADTTVYMRRGQFYDQPDMRDPTIARRSGDDDDAFASHFKPDDTADYEYRPPSRKLDGIPLHASWGKAQDTRAYAERLSKYHPVFAAESEQNYRQTAVQVDLTPKPQPGENRIITASPFNYYKLTSPPYPSPRRSTVTPNILVFTDVWESDSTKIIMRYFIVSSSNDLPIEADDYEDAKKYFNMAPTPRVESESKGNISKQPMRYWNAPTPDMPPDYNDDLDGDDDQYKPG